MAEESLDLEDQQAPEQFVEEDSSLATVSKEVYQMLKEQKKREKYYAKINEAKNKKHKAQFHRINNINHYVCDECKIPFEEKTGGALMYSSQGEFAYCNKCLKEKYPNYKRIYLATTVSKSSMLSNNFESQYSKGFRK